MTQRRHFSMPAIWTDEQDPIAFVDCEASSLDNLSYPIEIGLAWSDGRRESFLVRPHASWKAMRWSPEAEKIHGLRRATIEQHGRPVAELANWLNERLQGSAIYSDNPSFDGRWLSVLHQAAGVRPGYKVHSIQDAFMPEIQRQIPDASGLPAFNKWFSDMDARVRKVCPHTHRAADDAFFWAVLYQVLKSGEGILEQLRVAAPTGP